MSRQLSYSLALVWIFTSFITTLLFPLSAQAEAPTKPITQAVTTSAASSELFGIVGRDPWYEWNTNPAYPNAMNYEFMENMARQMALMGTRWVRIEFRADVVGGIRGGVFNYQKYDDFIFKIAPRYNLKVLGLIGADIITSRSASDPDLYYPRINDNADQNNRTNNYIRVFTNRAKEIADHYGDSVHAYEVLNEPNIWYGFSVHPDRMGALLRFVYQSIKPAHPNVQFIMGGSTTPGAPGSDVLGYLSLIYNSPAVQEYKNAGNYIAGNPFPFDGVGWHPYFIDNVDQNLNNTREVAARMRQAGDTRNKLWITEVGRPGKYNDLTCGPSSEEAVQADYLYRYYKGIMDNDQDKVATVFWFKYEDFYDGDTTHSWGLVKLDTDNKNGYKASGRAIYLKAGYYTYQSLANPNPGGLGLPIDKVPAPANQYSPTNPDGPFYLAETGHTLSGPFLKYWLKNGGLELFGFPLTEPFEEVSRTDGKRYTVQYFERERFEYHPENKNTPYEVLLGLLGNDVLVSTCRTFPRVNPPTTPLSADRVYFPQTGHYLSFGFKGYWQQYGGLFIFGYPVSEAFNETGTDGKNYVVQYFERARFEYHPEFVGTKFEVQLGLLGFQVLRQRGWVR